MSFVMGVYILLIGYGGSLISVLTVNVFPPPMRTMRELADNIHDHVGFEIEFLSFSLFLFIYFLRGNTGSLKLARSKL